MSPLPGMFFFVGLAAAARGPPGNTEISPASARVGVAAGHRAATVFSINRSQSFWGQYQFNTFGFLSVAAGFIFFFMLTQRRSGAMPSRSFSGRGRRCGVRHAQFINPSPATG